MPELPEVECFTHYFNRNALHHTISDVQIKPASLLKKTSVKSFNSHFIGQQFKHAVRRGKFLIAMLEKSAYKLVIHFGMTGDIFYAKQKNITAQDRRFTKLTISFKNGYQLLWNNARKFGRIYVVKEINEISTIKNMGPEPLKLSEKKFLALLQVSERKNIKAFLMDQSDIAGIGNEYSNEILFQAHINPRHAVADLTVQRRKKLYQTIQRVLKKAIKIRQKGMNFPKTWLLAHKEDMICPIGKKHLFTKEKVAGRSAIFCKKHQV